MDMKRVVWRKTFGVVVPEGVPQAKVERIIARVKDVLDGTGSDLFSIEQVFEGTGVTVDAKEEWVDAQDGMVFE